MKEKWLTPEKALDYLDKKYKFVAKSNRWGKNSWYAFEERPVYGNTDDDVIKDNPTWFIKCHACNNKKYGYPLYLNIKWGVHCADSLVERKEE